MRQSYASRNPTPTQWALGADRAKSGRLRLPFHVHSGTMNDYKYCIR